MFSEVHKRAKKAGLPPGTAFYTGAKKQTQPVLTVAFYNKDDCVIKTGHELTSCLIEKKEVGITWLNIEGLHDTDIIKDVAQNFHLHPLTIEDILNVEQRPKVEEFEDYIFITLKALIANKSTNSFFVQQVSLVLGKNFLLSFHELDTSLFDNIHERLAKTANQRLRQQGPDYLAYRLMDAIIDEYFVVLETIGDQLEKTEESIINNPEPQTPRIIYRMKRQMLLLRKAIWPMREAMGHLMHGEEEFITPFTQVYLRDLYDHTVQAIDTLETFRDLLSNMLDMYLSSLTNRMNEIMKTLTIITTIFIPITAIASIYGMNFEIMPGLHSIYGYPIALVCMVGVAILMMVYFWRKKWL